MLAAWMDPLARLATPAPGCVELEKRCAALEKLVAELLARLEAAERSAKRQAAPFSKGPPKPKPKRPGRKSGEQHGTHGHRPPPDSLHLDETLDANLPQACPRPVPIAAAPSRRLTPTPYFRKKSRASPSAENSPSIAADAPPAARNIAADIRCKPPTPPAPPPAKSDLTPKPPSFISTSAPASRTVRSLMSFGNSSTSN